MSASSWVPADLSDTSILDPNTRGAVTDPPGRLPRAVPRCSEWVSFAVWAHLT